NRKKKRKVANLQRQQLSLHFQRTNLLPSRLNDIHTLTSLDEIHRSTTPILQLTRSRALHGSTDGHIAGFEPFPPGVRDEFAPRSAGVAPILAKHRGTAKLYFTYPLTARCGV